MKTEEVKVYANVKFPIDGVQYAMGEVGGSWGIGIENGELKKDEVEDVKKKALESLLSDMEKQLRERSKSVIDKLVESGMVEYEKEVGKKLELARQLVLDQKTKIKEYEKALKDNNIKL